MFFFLCALGLWVHRCFTIALSICRAFAIFNLIFFSYWQKLANLATHGANQTPDSSLVGWRWWCIPGWVQVALGLFWHIRTVIAKKTSTNSILLDWILHISAQPKGNNYNSGGHLVQHLDCAFVVALLSATVHTVLQMWHPELPEMKAEALPRLKERLHSGVRKHHRHTYAELTSCKTFISEISTSFHSRKHFLKAHHVYVLGFWKLARKKFLIVFRRSACQLPKIVQGKTKGATTKGQHRFRIFSHFSTLSHTISEFFPRAFPIQNKGF